MFLVWGGFATVLLTGASWAVQHTLQANFTNLSSQALFATRQSVHAMQDERVKRMQQASSLVMNSPELRALIAERSDEFSPDNLASLEERLDSLARMLDVAFVCVLDDRGNAIAQSSGSPWPDVPTLRQYLSKSVEADALIEGLFAPRTKSPSASGAADKTSDNYGLWVVNGRLMQTVGVPLIFENDDTDSSRAGAAPDGALIVGAPITDGQADELASSHGCELTFLTDGKVAASSVSAPKARAELPSLANASFGTEASVGGIVYRLATEKIVDPRSGQQVGTILIQSDQADALTVQTRVNRTLESIFGGGLLTVALGSYLLSRAITRPVAELLGGVRRVAGGDLSLSLPARRRDELGSLAKEFNDMVTQLRARRELERQIEESRAASRAKSQFLANMSHEIRTPLNGVIGMADLLLGTNLSERQHRYAALVKSSAEVLTTLINDALDFAKIESGKMELESIDFDLYTVVEEVAEIFAPKAFKKGLEIACDISGTTIRAARGDPNRLRQVLLNLVNNAIKFTQRGEIIVTVSPDVPAESMVRIAVIDTGAGIPPDRLDRLFRAFSQVDASTTRRFGGTGLGLVISKQLVELMGGKIGVETEEGRGSTFWFTVKLTPAEHLVLPPSARIEPAGALVLVAHADPTGRRVLAARILERGGKVFEASTADEIAAAIEQPELRFRIAIIGTVSPLQTALDSASAVAAQLAVRQTRVLCLVPADVEVTPPTLAAAGLSGCLTMPLRHSQLTDALNAAAGHSITQYASARSSDIDIVETHPGRILVADDHEVNRLLVVDMLEQAGLRCDAVSDGAQAVKQAASGNYDVILMDCQMPVMDGFDAVRAIRARERAAGSAGKHAHIIALTANVNEGARQRCIEAGMDDYCGKPIQRDQLLKAIRGSLKLAATQQPALTKASVGSTFKKSLDLETVLHRCSDKPALARTVLGKLALQSRDSLERIETCFAAADAVQVARIAHGLKGTAGMVAATTLEAAAGKLEQIAIAGDLSAANEVLASLQTEVLRCNQFIADALKELSVMDRADPSAGVRPAKLMERDDAGNNC